VWPQFKTRTLTAKTTHLCRSLYFVYLRFSPFLLFALPNGQIHATAFAPSTYTHYAHEMDAKFIVFLFTTVILQIVADKLSASGDGAQPEPSSNKTISTDKLAEVTNSAGYDIKSDIGDVNESKTPEILLVTGIVGGLLIIGVILCLFCKSSKNRTPEAEELNKTTYNTEDV